jgi:hypothetical protein
MHGSIILKKKKKVLASIRKNREFTILPLLINILLIEHCPYKMKIINKSCNTT